MRVDADHFSPMPPVASIFIRCRSITMCRFDTFDFATLLIIAHAYIRHATPRYDIIMLRCALLLLPADIMLMSMPLCCHCFICFMPLFFFTLIFMPPYIRYVDMPAIRRSVALSPLSFRCSRNGTIGTANECQFCHMARRHIAATVANTNTL